MAPGKNGTETGTRIYPKMQGSCRSEAGQAGAAGRRGSSTRKAPPRPEGEGVGGEGLPWGGGRGVRGSLAHVLQSRL